MLVAHDCVEAARQLLVRFLGVTKPIGRIGVFEIHLSKPFQTRHLCRRLCELLNRIANRFQDNYLLRLHPLHRSLQVMKTLGDLTKSVIQPRLLLGSARRLDRRAPTATAAGRLGYGLREEEQRVLGHQIDLIVAAQLLWLILKRFCH